MSMLPKEAIREKKFESADDILDTLKGMFRKVEYSLNCRVI